MKLTADKYFSFYKCTGCASKLKLPLALMKHHRCVYCDIECIDYELIPTKLRRLDPNTEYMKNESNRRTARFRANQVVS